MYKKSSNFLKKDHKSSKNVQTKLKFPKISSKLKKSSKKFKIQEKFKFSKTKSSKFKCSQNCIPLIFRGNAIFRPLWDSKIPFYCRTEEAFCSQ